MPVHNLNRTITQVTISQAAAGSSDLVAAPGADLKVYVVSIVFTMGAAGTFKFTEGTGPTDLTGAMNVSGSGGLVSIGDGINPILQTNTANSKLSIVTTGGDADGWIRYFIAA